MSRGKKPLVQIGFVLDTLYLVSERPYESAAQVGEKIGVSGDTVRSYLMAARQLGVQIHREGSARRGCYVIADWGVVDRERLAEGFPFSKRPSAELADSSLARRPHGAADGRIGC